jgi:Zn-dependent protease with chaperone function
MSRVNELRHPKETGYFTVIAIFSGLIWFSLIPLLILAAAAAMFAFPLILFGLFISWLSSLYFKAVVFGYSVKVSDKQYPEIYERATQLAQEMGVNPIPEIFIVSSDGVVNALAYRTLSTKYIFLYSSLVDLLMIKGHKKELDFVLAHELGHYAAGHNSRLKSFFLMPGKVIPFVGAAYSRACELTADRIGHYTVNDVQVSTRALTSIALGSAALLETVSIDAFKRQESQIPELMGFIHKIYSTHPRTTRRVIEIEAFEEYNRFLHTKTAPTASANQGTPGNQVFCSSCGTKNNTTSTFCENCGNKLK